MPLNWINDLLCSIHHEWNPRHLGRRDKGLSPEPWKLSKAKHGAGFWCAESLLVGCLETPLYHYLWMNTRMRYWSFPHLASWSAVELRGCRLFSPVVTASLLLTDCVRLPKRGWKINSWWRCMQSYPRALYMRHLEILFSLTPRWQWYERAFLTIFYVEIKQIDSHGNYQRFCCQRTTYVAMTSSHWNA